MKKLSCPSRNSRRWYGVILPEIAELLLPHAYRSEMAYYHRIIYLGAPEGCVLQSYCHLDNGLKHETEDKGPKKIQDDWISIP